MFAVIIVVIIIILIVKSIINEQRQKLLKEILMTLKLENIDTLLKKYDDHVQDVFI